MPDKGKKIPAQKSAKLKPKSMKLTERRSSRLEGVETPSLLNIQYLPSTNNSLTGDDSLPQSSIPHESLLVPASPQYKYQDEDPQLPQLPQLSNLWRGEGEGIIGKSRYSKSRESGKTSNLFVKAKMSPADLAAIEAIPSPPGFTDFHPIVNPEKHVIPQLQRDVKEILGKASTSKEQKGGYIKTKKGKRKIHTGKRGGKYIMMGGKKKYIK